MAATAIGMMANMILPVRLGEIVRAVVLGHRERIDKSAAFATVVVDRLLDGFTILFILGLILLVAPLPVDQAWQRRLQWGGMRLLPALCRRVCPALLPLPFTRSGAPERAASLLTAASPLGGQAVPIFGILQWWPADPRSHRISWPDYR